MRSLRQVWLNYCRSTRASAIEFAFMMPILFIVLVGAIDGGILFARHAKAQQVAESLVRTARALDQQLTSINSVPLNDDTLALLTNIAARMPGFDSTLSDYIWIGRFVRTQDGTDVNQTLPQGMRGAANNAGIILAGDVNSLAEAHSAALDAFNTALRPGDIVYVATVRFTQGLLSPVPASLKRLPVAVRFAL